MRHPHPRHRRNGQFLDEPTSGLDWREGGCGSYGPKDPYLNLIGFYKRNPNFLGRTYPYWLWVLCIGRWKTILEYFQGSNHFELILILEQWESCRVPHRALNLGVFGCAEFPKGLLEASQRDIRCQLLGIWTWNILSGCHSLLGFGAAAQANVSPLVCCFVQSLWISYVIGRFRALWWSLMLLGIY